MSGDTSATAVKALREATQAGMADCKKALVETNGNMQEAIVVLRKKGLASAGKKEGREAKEGVIGYAEDSSAFAIVEINCESDFVSRSEGFQAYVKEMAHAALTTKAVSAEDFVVKKHPQHPSDTIDQYRQSEMMLKLGENIQIKRLIRLEKAADSLICVYSHLGKGALVTAVELTHGNGEGQLGHDIAMQVASSAPQYLTPEGVPSEVKAGEEDIHKSKLLQQGKPEKMFDKIIPGMLKKFYAETCLLEQAFIKDDALSIAQVIAKRSKETGKHLAVKRVIRWALGTPGGIIEK